MIRFGPAGIPLSCKGRTLKDGIEDVHNLSLTALEIQMVRSTTVDAYPDDEDIGKTIKDIDDRLVIELIRDDETICDPDEPIQEDDIMVQMASGITNGFGSLYGIGKMAKRLDVAVSLHAPNYMDLGSNSELTGSCLDSIRHSALIVNALEGDIVVTNLGLYNGKDSNEDVEANIYDNVADLMKWWKGQKLKPKLGVEITGQQDVFGSLDQVLDICKSNKGLVPVINWPNYHSRTSGSLIEPEDFKNVIDQVAPYCKNSSMYTVFAGVEHADGNELRLTPIKKGDLKFDTLAECLVEERPEMTIISSSPLLEHDAMYMRIIHERYLSKKVAKMMRAKKKESEGATDVDAEKADDTVKEEKK
jgi:deoxyribonuclease-4